MKQFVIAALAVFVVGYSLCGERWCAADDVVKRVTIDSKRGPVTGLQTGDVLQFRGIRYAEPPTGERRFLPPVPAKPWTGTFEATEYPNRSVQQPGALGAGRGKLDEDCLFLNIVTPATDGKLRPVLFWIHGGAYTQGSANAYDGSVLAAQGDVVVVTINYRLGLLGFGDLSSLGDEYAGSAGNGFRDQILALQWVHDNIADYGGDPNNVTIFGESAGGGSVHALLAAPSADGLYHKAIAHSPGTANVRSQDQTSEISKQLGVSGDELLNKLQTMPVDEILELQTAVGTNGGQIDGTVVTRSTNEAILERGNNGVPLIAGTNLDEGTLFTMLLPPAVWDELGKGLATSVTSGADPTKYLAALKAAYPDDTEKQNHERIWVDMFRHSAIGSTQRATEAGPGGWLYRFDLPATAELGGNKMGATHAAEIAFTFNSFAGAAAGPLNLYDRNDPAVKDLAKRWSDTIIAFAKTGDPNGAGLPRWPRYRADNRQTLILDGTPRVEKDVDRKHRELWQSVGAEL